ncbi:MAG: tRNA pseudouridine38-40 synthase [Maribacter sp.]|jgi:tRNA pseudouridine38-40 synthase
MRYFGELAYNGTNYFGWQRQPNEMSVQQMIEEAMSMIFRMPIQITGCGRTDTGVHASQYFIHFDFDGVLPKGLSNRLNKILPKDIAFHRIFEVESRAHARFDAYSRSYEYHLNFRKNPFQEKTTYYYYYAQIPDFDKMQEAAALILEYNEFATFCKAHHDAKTMICHLTRSEWKKIDEYHWVYYVTSNRFLRGMIRLVVGMCMNVGRDKITLDDVRKALEDQVQLENSLSVQPEGLYLKDIKYPFL